MKYVNLEVLTVLKFNTKSYWVMTPCSLVDRQHYVTLVGLENFIFPEDETCSFVSVTVT